MRDKIFLKNRHSSHYYYAKNNGDWHHLEGKGKQSGNINWGTHHAVILNSSMQKDREEKVAIFLQPLAVCGQKEKVVLERGARVPLESAGAHVQRGQHFSFWGMCCEFVVFSFFFLSWKMKISWLPPGYQTQLHSSLLLLKYWFYLLTWLLEYYNTYQGPRINIFLNHCREKLDIGKEIQKVNLTFLAFTQNRYSPCSYFCGDFSCTNKH